MLAEMVVSGLRSSTDSGLVVGLNTELIHHLLLQTLNLVFCFSVIRFDDL